jgi:hypothetical protein
VRDRVFVTTVALGRDINAGKHRIRSTAPHVSRCPNAVAVLSVKDYWPLVSLLPIAANSWSGQVLSRSSSRVRSPGSSTGAVALRSQTGLTGSDRPRTIRAAGAGTTPRAHMKLAVGRAARISSFAPADRRWPGRSGSASGSEGQGAEAAARAARRAALKPYRKFSHGRWRDAGQLGQLGTGGLQPSTISWT